MPKSAKVAPLIENEPVGVVNGDGPASGSSSPELTERERGNVPTYRVHGSTDETMTVGGNKPQEGWNDLVLQLLTERRRTIGQVHCTPPFLTHIETKGMANLSQLVYKTVGTERGEPPEYFIRDSDIAEIVDTWPRDDRGLPKVRPTGHEYLAWRNMLPDYVDELKVSYEEWAASPQRLSDDELAAWLARANQIIGMRDRDNQTSYDDLLEFLQLYPDFHFCATSENIADLHGKVGVSKFRRKVFVAFRGTSAVNDVVSDVTFCTKPMWSASSAQEFHTAAPGCAWLSTHCWFLPCFSDAHVHSGFLGQLMSTEFSEDRYLTPDPTGRDRVDRALTGKQPSLLALLRHVEREVNEIQDEILREPYARTTDLKELRLFVTGHSLGAGVATLFSYAVCKSRPDLAVNLVTFGSPRVGAWQFKRELNSFRNLRNLRVVNGCDAITHIPSCGFVHAGDLLWITPGWIARLLCMDTPIAPLEKTPEGGVVHRGTSCDVGITPHQDLSGFGKPPPFERMCCIPCRTEKPFARTFAGPTPAPPWCASAGYVGLCCGCLCTCTPTIADHSMGAYGDALGQADHLAYWFTETTMRDKNVRKQATSICCRSCRGYGS